MKVPTTDLARRVAALVRRRPTTPWNDREIRQYKKLVKGKCFDALDDLVLLEQFYAFERKRGDNGIHRRDLLTLLNNYPGEIDKAIGWRERHPTKPVPRTIIPMPLLPSEQPLVVGDPGEIARFTAEYEQRKAAKGKSL